jgi:hypothetical protein
MTHPAETAPIETVIVPRARDLGDFEVRRALPASERQMIGPFIFLDQAGPATFAPGKAVDVRPHPHIGLATVTWLLDGELLHRDSLGYVQPITAGALNWMTAGRGIVHSERTPDRLRGTAFPLFGVQSWVALPKAHEEAEPSFVHYGADALPKIEGEGKSVSLIVGSGWGKASPVEVLWGTFFADAALEPGAVLTVPKDVEERGIYSLEGEIEIAGDRFSPGRLLVLRSNAEVEIKSPAKKPGGARFVIVGGDAMDGPRHIWWNLVSSRPDRIEQAKEDWKSGRFPEVPGDSEYIPLPD